MAIASQVGKVRSEDGGGNDSFNHGGEEGGGVVGWLESLGSSKYCGGRVHCAGAVWLQKTEKAGSAEEGVEIIGGR